MKSKFAKFTLSFILVLGFVTISGYDVDKNVQAPKDEPTPFMIKDPGGGR